MGSYNKMSRFNHKCGLPWFSRSLLLFSFFQSSHAHLHTLMQQSLTHSIHLRLFTKFSIHTVSYRSFSFWWRVWQLFWQQLIWRVVCNLHISKSSWWATHVCVHNTFNLMHHSLYSVSTFTDSPSAVPCSPFLLACEQLISVSHPRVCALYMYFNAPFSYP